MADTAARLTDEVFPQVPVRQWVLSLPYQIRYRLAWDGARVGAVLAVFLRVLYGRYRRPARQQGCVEARCGSATFVQRCGGALNLNPHDHVVMPDGVFVAADDVQRLVETTAKRVVRLRQRRGLLDDVNADPLWLHEPLLATLTAASVQGRVATGDRAGQPVRRRLVDPEEGFRNSATGHWRRGYARRAVAAWCAAARREGLIGFCSTNWSNSASRALARSLGLTPFAAELRRPG